MQSVLGADGTVTAVVGEERATCKLRENGLVIDDKCYCTDDGAFVLLTDVSFYIVMIRHWRDFNRWSHKLRDHKFKTKLSNNLKLKKAVFKTKI